MFKRNSEVMVRRALGDTPVVFLNGARQTGKTTLVRALAATLPDATYVTLDDASVLAAAVHDPAGFLRQLTGTVIIDEVQKAPALFPAIKVSVDQDRRPGRFLLTGSANVLALPALSESLAGRMEIITLRALSQGEFDGQREGFVDRLLAGEAIPSRDPACPMAAVALRIHRGGYPEAAQRPPDRRASWFASYLTAILQRDVRDLSHIAGLTETPRLLALLAARSGSILNVAEVSREAGIPYTTLHRYLALFEATFLVHRIPAWSANLGKRLVKAHKLLLCDTGFMAYLLNAAEGQLLDDPRLSGHALETFVGCELLKQRDWSPHRPALFHYRTAAGAEVDFVLEAGTRRIVGIEVKRATTLKSGDFRGLRSLAADAGDRFVAGVVLYSGEQVLPFGDRLWAVPMGGLWSPAFG
jgi:hypothetical protein